MTSEVSLEKIYSLEEFTALPEPEDGTSYELLDGKLLVMTPTGRKHGKLGGNLYGYLWNFAREHQSGEVYQPDTGFIMQPDTVRIPDVAFVAAGRLTEDVEDEYIQLAPDLAVEVISPTDRLTEVAEKARFYQKAGVRLVWVINPRKQTVQVYHEANTTPTLLSIEDELDGEDVLPGFKLKIRTLFEYK